MKPWRQLRPLAAVLVVAVTALAAGARASEWTDVKDSFGVLETVAGAGELEVTLETNDWLPSFEGAPATQVELSNPHMAAADAFGNIYIADKASHSVLKVDREGRCTTFAGTHVAGFNGHGPAPATAVQLDGPNGLFVLPEGTVYIYDSGNRRIRRVGRDGTLTTVVWDRDPNGTSAGRGLWVSPDEKTIFYTDTTVVKRWVSPSPLSVTSVVATGFVNCGNIDVHPLTGRLYVTDRAEDDPVLSAVWRIEADGSRTRVAGNQLETGGGSGSPALGSTLDEVRGIAFLPTGGYFLCTHKGSDVWYVQTDGTLRKYLQGRGTDNLNKADGEHPPVTDRDIFSEARSVTIAPNGDLLLCANDTGYIRRVRSVAALPQPRGLRVALSTNGCVLTWGSAPGALYVMERSADLRTWTPLEVVRGTGGDVSWLDTAAHPAGGAVYYRVGPPLR